MTRQKPGPGKRTGDLVDRFRKAFWSLARPGLGPGIVVAFSGGADSTALLALSVEVLRPGGARLTAAHLDHGLRGAESRQDREEAAVLAGRLGVPFLFEEIEGLSLMNRPGGLSLEAAARRVRYRFLKRVREAQGADYILTGHTADDNAEAVLLNLLRGSGPAGLAGIPPVREGFILRPLLSFWREELEGYLAERGLSYVKDSTNQDLAFTRNRVRHELIPYLAERYNPRVKEALVRAARLMRDEEEAWAEVLGNLGPEAFCSVAAGQVRLSVGALTGRHRAVGRRMVREGVRRLMGRVWGLSLARVDEVLDLAAQGEEKGLDLPRGLRAWVQAGDLYLGLQTAPCPVDDEQALPVPGRVFLQVSGLEIVAELRPMDAKMDPRSGSPDVAHLDWDRLSPPLAVRNPRPGDRFQPLGMSGVKKVGDFFTDAKVPVHLRANVPLVVDRERIVWLGGYRPDERARLRPDTRQVLTLTLRQA